jgi:hypothetical protein
MLVTLKDCIDLFQRAPFRFDPIVCLWNFSSPPDADIYMSQLTISPAITMSQDALKYVSW